MSTHYFWLLFGFLSIGVGVRTAFAIFSTWGKWDWTKIILDAGITEITGAVACLIIAIAINVPVVLAIALIVAGLLSAFWISKLNKKVS